MISKKKETSRRKDVKRTIEKRRGRKKTKEG